MVRFINKTWEVKTENQVDLTLFTVVLFFFIFLRSNIQAAYILHSVDLEF